MRVPARWTRRALIGRGLAAAGAALLAAGCDGSGGRPQPTRPDADADAQLLARARAREADLINRYDAVLAATSAQRSRLAVIRGEHQAHLAALPVPAGPAGSAASGGSPAGTGTHPPTPSPDAPGFASTGASVPSLGRRPSPAGTSARAGTFPAARAGPQPVIARLVQAERAAAAAAVRDCSTASPDLAALLGSIGASEAGHAAALGGPA